MTCRTFSDTSDRRSQLIRTGSLFYKRAMQRRCGQCGALIFFAETNELSHTSTHQRERRQEHPEPPCLTHRHSGKGDRDDKKCDAEKDVFECTVQRHFLAMSAPVSSVVNFDLGRLHDLSSHSLRNQADIRTAAATKTRTIKIVCGAFWTEHLFFASHVSCSLPSCLIQKHSGRD